MSTVRNDHLCLFQGRYAFHLHTTATDGQLEVADYVRYAKEHRLDQLIFLEHIRRQPTYDVSAFIDTVRRAADAGGVAVSVGFEAKVLPGGHLDIDDKDLARAEVIGIAEHGFLDDGELLADSLDAAFERYAGLAGEKNVVWVHPGLGLRKRGWLEQDPSGYRAMIGRAWDLGIAVERNLRYGLVPDGVLSDSERLSLVVGVDAHRERDLVRAFPDSQDLPLD